MPLIEKIIKTGLKEHTDQETWKILDKIKPGRALDIGCGDGNTSLYLVKKGFKIVAIDSDTQAFLATKRQLKGQPCKIVTGDFLKFSSNWKFDLIIFREVLEHIKDDCSALKKIYQLLNKNGIALITVPGQKYLYGSHDKKAGHFRRYQKDELCLKIHQAGFKVELFQSLGFPFFNFTTFVYNHLFHKNKFKHTGLNKPYKNLIFLSKKVLPLRFFGFVSKVFKNKPWGAQFVLLVKKF